LNNKNAGSCEPNRIEIEFDTGVHKGYKDKILSKISTMKIEGSTDAHAETNRHVAIRQGK
jgi:hypothetical protein